MVVGVRDAMLTNAELRARGRPAETIAGNYNHSYRILQFGDSLADVYGRFLAMDAKLAGLSPAGTVVLPPPAPAANTIPPLSPATISVVIAGMQYCSRWSWHPAFALRVKTELTAGVYTYVDKAFIDGVNDFYYSPCIRGNAAYRDALYGYLAIIDQRVPGTDQLLALTDPRLKRVGTSTVVTVPATTTTMTGMVNGKLCVLDGPGAVPALCSLSQTGGIFLGLGADVAFCSNVDGSSPAGVAPNKPHCGRIGVAPEGGIRIGYNDSFNNPFYDPAHGSATLGFDSAGELSLSQQCSIQQPGCSPHEYTQDMVVRINEPAKEIIFASYRPGWKFCFVTSTGLTTIDKKYCLPTQ